MKVVNLTDKEMATEGVATLLYEGWWIEKSNETGAVYMPPMFNGGEVLVRHNSTNGGNSTYTLVRVLPCQWHDDARHSALVTLEEGDEVVDPYWVHNDLNFWKVSKRQYPNIPLTKGDKSHIKWLKKEALAIKAAKVLEY